jgi:hypothetical protein
MRKVIESSPSTPTHEQLLIIKEYTDICKKMLEYDDDGKLRSNKAKVIDVINKVLSDYDALVSRYQMVEKELINAKVKYAESEEIKERLLVEIDTIMGHNNVSKGDKSICLTDEEGLNGEMKQSDNMTSGIFAKATNLFSSASNFYSGRFGKN